MLQLIGFLACLVFVGMFVCSCFQTGKYPFSDIIEYKEKLEKLEKN